VTGESLDTGHDGSASSNRGEITAGAEPAKGCSSA